MIKEIEEILQKIISCGYDAYIVGGYVRDFILDRHTNDIDIATNALPKDLTSIFEQDNIKISSYGSVKLTKGKYFININTFRKENEYKDGKPINIEYVNSLDIDIKRRDFTINALYMNKNGSIIDRTDGLKDIANKVIRVIGKTDEKLKEDPLRILRALRLKIVLNFSLDEQIVKFINQNKKELKKIPKPKIKEEVNKILMSKNSVDGFKYLKKLNILDILEINYKSLTIVDDISGMYAQLILPDDFPLTKEEKENCKKIKEIINYKKIDYSILFKYGLYLSSVAGKILNVNKKKINKLYMQMPIKSENELDIDGEEIMKILEIEPSKKIKEIRNELIILVLNGKLINENKVLKEYLINHKGMWLQ